MLEPRPVRVGVLATDPPAPGVRAALAFFEAAWGVPVVWPGPDDPLPDRVLVLGEGDFHRRLAGARLVVRIPWPDPEVAERLDWVEPGPLPVLGHPRRYADSEDLPWRYLRGGRPISWSHRPQGTHLRFGFDVLGPAVRALARGAERGPDAQAWRRSRVADLPPGEQPLVLTPWLDRLANLLARVLDLDDGQAAGPLPRWPGGARWAVALSHDVDMLFKWRFRTVLRLLLETPPLALGGGLQDLARRWRELARRVKEKRDPWFLVDELMDIEERRGLHSTLLFLAEPRDHQTYRYQLDRLQVRSLLARVRERGFESALHGGWGSHGRPARLAAQRRRLASAGGGTSEVTRQHWLRFDIRRTWQTQLEAGLTVDSTLGFNDQPGFRAGTSLPFHPLDEDGSPMRTLEIPLILMDSQLFDEQRLELPAAARLTQDAVEQVRRVRGLLTVNWHPHTLCREDFPGRRELFEELLGVMSRRDCWTAGLGDVAAHWREREARLAALPAGAADGPASAQIPREADPCAC